jgi:hypothetical protein
VRNANNRPTKVLFDIVLASDTVFGPVMVEAALAEEAPRGLRDG